jgi:hypothetical protein
MGMKGRARTSPLNSAIGDKVPKRVPKLAAMKRALAEADAQRVEIWNSVQKPPLQYPRPGRASRHLYLWVSLTYSSP